MTRWYPQVDGAGQVESQIRTKGWPPNTLIFDVSDWIEFAGVHPINLVHEPIMGITKVFAAIHVTYSDADGRCVLDICPPLIHDGIYKNASNPTVNGALVDGPGSALFKRAIGLIWDGERWNEPQTAGGGVMAPIEYTKTGEATFEWHWLRSATAERPHRLRSWWIELKYLRFYF